MRNGFGGDETVILFPCSKASVTIAQWNLELWPGYETSIRQHEKSLLLNCDIKCKVSG